MTRIGAIFSPYTNAPEELHDAVVAAEESGVAELWIWEDCFRHSAFAVASAALAWTERLRIGIGIAPMPLRNVAATAMEIATIERLFPGRLLPGVGHGVQSWMGQVGAKVASPLTLLQEYVPALRGLLAGEEMSVDGRYVTLEGVRLDWPPAQAPLVYAAAEGPKTLNAVGRVADGVVLDSRHTAGELARSVERVRAGRAEAGREGAADVVAYVVTAFGPDAAARAVASLDDSVYGSLGSEDGAERVLAGSVDEVAAGVQRLLDAGVDDVVLQPTADARLSEFYASVGEVTGLIGG